METYKLQRCHEWSPTDPLYQIVRGDGRVMVDQETLTVCDGVLESLAGRGPATGELVEVADSIRRAEAF